MDKYHYVDYSTIHKHVKFLAECVKEANYKSDLIVAIGSGGFIPARILKTFLDLPILAVGISYYALNNKPLNFPQKIQWIDEAQQQLNKKRILLIDEVDDTRTTLLYCIEELLKYNPSEIAVLVLHNKRKKKAGEFPPEVSHYFVAQEIEDLWIKYPWDALDIELHNKKCKESKE
ncbi:MAG: phosphoribosyltransferase [Sphaerochaetaceae bacterium]